jgi:hypothetical protein
MEYAAAMAALPGDDALALFLADAGAPEQVIAERLEIEPESVGPLLEVARRKLAAQLRRHTPAPPAGGGSASATHSRSAAPAGPAGPPGDTAAGT